MQGLSKVGTAAMLVIAAASCASADHPARRGNISYEASKAIDDARDRGLAPSGGPDERISISKSMDKYRSTPLKIVDDETGKTLVICRWQKPKGSMFPKKVCATQKEIDAQRDANREELDDLRYNRH